MPRRLAVDWTSSQAQSGPRDGKVAAARPGWPRAGGAARPPSHTFQNRVRAVNCLPVHERALVNKRYSCPVPCESLSLQVTVELVARAAVSRVSPTIYRASGESSFLRGLRKGRIDRYHQNVLCECPFCRPPKARTSRMSRMMSPGGRPDC